MIEVEVTPAVLAVARELLADGATNAEIAERLELTEDTVKAHVKALFRVSGCTQRTEFVTKVFHRRVKLHPGSHTRPLEAKEVA